jgi:hypothetical protein
MIGLKRLLLGGMSGGPKLWEIALMTEDQRKTIIKLLTTAESLAKDLEESELASDRASN